MAHIFKPYLLMLLLGITYNAMAWNFPDYYPDDFPNTGIFNKAEPNSGTLFIDGRAYKIAPDLVVHSLGTKFGSINSLRTNMPIAFESKRIGNMYYIYTIWTLPSNYDFSDKG